MINSINSSTPPSSLNPRWWEPSPACRRCTPDASANSLYWEFQQRQMERMLELYMRQLREQILGELMHSRTEPGRAAAGKREEPRTEPVRDTESQRRNDNDKDNGGQVPDRVQKFIDKAKSHQGDPYVFGAESNGRYDCSGLVYASLKEAGINVPRLTAKGYQKMFSDSAVSREQLKPGDLVFFHTPNNRGIPAGKATHIEIYLGNGMTMGTDNPAEGARIERIDWKNFIGGARVPQLYR